MDADTARPPEDDRDRDEDEDDGGHRFPFDPRPDDGTPLGDTGEHSDADA